MNDALEPGEIFDFPGFDPDRLQDRHVIPMGEESILAGGERLGGKKFFIETQFAKITVLLFQAGDLIEFDQKLKVALFRFAHAEAARDFTDAFVRQISFSVDDQLQETRRFDSGLTIEDAVGKAGLLFFEIKKPVFKKTPVIHVIVDGNHNTKKRKLISDQL
jgi:hypothetical protein